MEGILERIRRAPLVFDGAMGTLLYSRGVFVNACYDEQNLRNPELVLGVHREYVEAGADVIETNTFGANRIKLGGYGLAEETERINRRGAALAREAAGGGGVWVAGSVGPCTHSGQLLTPEREAEVAEAFREQIGVLAEAGVDLLVLETFSDLREAELAAAEARRTGVSVLASFAVNEEGVTAFGTSAGAIVDALERNGDVDWIGFNCGQGPAGLFAVVERVIRRATKPMVAMPNAGFPREVEGRLLYLTSPEYFTKYAKRGVEIGLRGVGGCCGTTPEHIRVMARAVKSLSGVKEQIEIRIREVSGEEEGGFEPIPAEEKSRLGRKLARGEIATSVELLPPRTADLGPMIARVRRAAEAGVDCINIPDGPRASARVSCLIAALEIVRSVPRIEPILHYCCRDRNLIGMQADLLGGYAAGLRNYLIITGDPPKLGDYPDVTGVFDVDSIGLVRVAANLNRGFDLGGNPMKTPTGILIGVGANPCAVDLDREMDRYFRKIDSGAEFCITQPVFDLEALNVFLDRAARHSRTIPVIAGIWPLASYRNAEFMNNEVPGVVVRPEILERMSRCTTKEEARETGIEIARETVARIRDRVQGFQVSAPFGRLETALAVLEDVLEG